MKAAGKPTDRPNLAMGVNVQVCWDKLCRYWDLEPRLAPMEGDRFHLSAEAAVALCEQNTIGVVAILGSTLDGSHEPVSEICSTLDALAASVVRISRFTRTAPRAGSWRHLCSLISSGSSRSRACIRSTRRATRRPRLPGVGWAIWRDSAALPRDPVFKVNYLGGKMPTLPLADLFLTDMRKQTA
jgi:glutamate decarboxylase